MVTQLPYNNIGKKYSKYRRTDPRIAYKIVELLGLSPEKMIADVGAGTGNYSYPIAERGFKVKALEPSPIMRRQARKTSGNVEWLDGTAEKIPLLNNSVNGVICILALHHFESLENCFAEMARICHDGPIVIFTFDPRYAEEFWFADYFPGIWKDTFGIFPPIEDVEKLLAEITDRNVITHTFELPNDIEDYFMAAGWQKPEIYLDPEVRACMSGFTLADQTEVNRGIKKLKKNLDNGNWENKYGHLRKRKLFDSGYRFLVAK